MAIEHDLDKESVGSAELLALPPEEQKASIFAQGLPAPPAAPATTTTAVTQPATPSGTISSIPTGDNAATGGPSVPSFIGGVLSTLTPSGQVGSGPSDMTGGIVDSGAPNAGGGGSPLGLYLLLAGLAVAAYLIYRHYKKKHERGGEHHAVAA